MRTDGTNLGRQTGQARSRPRKMARKAQREQELQTLASKRGLSVNELFRERASEERARLAEQIAFLQRRQTERSWHY